MVRLFPAANGVRVLRVRHSSKIPWGIQYDTFLSVNRLYYGKPVSLYSFNMDLSAVRFYIVLYNGADPYFLGAKGFK